MCEKERERVRERERKRERKKERKRELVIECVYPSPHPLPAFVLKRPHTTMPNAAKCHEHHVMIATKHNEHIRGSLLFIADTQ